ncbi:zf-HC2 domain-containing protein [Streptomyces corynorhini]|uniref:Zf-HC2 domain-containing protein n=1 Tax=Streptomyces corynorhini TaxID=2282652 RepID=A0A370BGI2_9ACTN|nr:zf-HC2 domain-containing protein [Streptomyces corynorhini]RDG38903.1 zf-HC2 domain-containing protein [Streptomyces corynorhini]
MSVEHASAGIINGYARGDMDMAADEVWALEAHLEACRHCRDRLSAATMTHTPSVAHTPGAAGTPGAAETTSVAGTPNLTGTPSVAALVDRVWADLAPQLAATAPPRHRLLWPASLSRRLSRWLTPTMLPWLGTLVSVTLLALLLDLFGPGYGYSLGAGTGTGAEAGTEIGAGSGSGAQVSFLLLLAPILPVFGVAASWSRGLDPAYELTASAPRAGLHLVLRRTASVLAVVVPVLLVGGWATGVTAGLWLLPCLAFTSTALALGSVIGVSRAAVALVSVWAAVILAPAVATSRVPSALRLDGAPVWGLILALGIGVVWARRSAYSVLGTHR